MVSSQKSALNPGGGAAATAANVEAYLDLLGELIHMARGGAAADVAAALADAQRVAARGLREAVSLARESGMSWRDLAERLDMPATSLYRHHRIGDGLAAPLRDSAPARTYLTARAAAPSPAASLPAADSAWRLLEPRLPPLPGNLFVGREVELADLPGRLRRQRLVTLTGPAGVGKTRLALEAAHQLAVSFGGGAHWAQLTALAASSDPQHIAWAIEHAIRSGEPPDALGRVLGDRGQVLLVLDNCEHLAAACGDLVLRLLDEQPALTVLATSREALEIAGEAQVRITPLPAAPTDSGDPWLAGSAAVRLFQDRARLAAHDAVLAGHEPVIASICNALDGLPMAIELAARQCAVLPVTALQAQVSRQLDLRAPRASTLLGPHSGLRAAIAWSYDLLGPIERALFRRIAALPEGACDLTAAALIEDLGQDRAALWSVLTSLAGKSMLMTQERAPRRFGMLAATREYGREQLEVAGETAATDEAIITWFARQAEEVLADRYRAGRLELRAWALQELAGFRFATEAARRNGDGRYPRLAIATAVLLVGAAGPAAAQELLEPVLREPGLSADDAVWARIATSVACQQSGDVAAAQTAARQAAELAKHTGGSLLRYQANAALIFARGHDDPARAAVLSEAEVGRLRALGDTELLPTMLNSLAYYLLVCGRVNEAVSAATEMLTLRGDAASSNELHTAGAAALASGDVERAAMHFTSGLAGQDNLGTTLDNIEGLAIAATHRGEHRHALRLIAAAATHRAELGLPNDTWWAMQVSVARTAARGQLTPRQVGDAEKSGARIQLEQLRAAALGSHEDSRHRPSPLSNREVAIARLVASGHTTRQIAARLGASPSTVNTHITRARTKLGLANRTELGAWAARHINSGL